MFRMCCCGPDRCEFQSTVVVWCWVVGSAGLQWWKWSTVVDVAVALSATHVLGPQWCKCCGVSI